MNPPKFGKANKPTKGETHVPTFRLSDISPEEIEMHEKRAGVTLAALMEDIIQARTRIKPGTASNLPWSTSCNNPELKAEGQLKEMEESRAYRMLAVISHYRGPDERQGVPLYSLSGAYRKVGVDSNTIDFWRVTYPLFGRVLEAVQAEMVDTMRAEVYRRAVVGHEEPLVYQGEPTGHHIRKYSDTLLQFSLMGHDNRYRQKDVNMNVTGQLDTNINIEGLREKLQSRLLGKLAAQKETGS